MAQSNHPSKYLVRAYLERRSHDIKPPPTPDEIRRQLGWGLRLCGWPYCSTSRS
jgi:hypothetical protein